MTTPATEETPIVADPALDDIVASFRDAPPDPADGAEPPAPDTTAGGDEPIPATFSLPGADPRDGDGTTKATHDPNKYATRFKCVLRCVSVGQELDGDEVVTAAKFKHSHHEDGMRVAYKLKCMGGYLSRKFKPGEYYGLQVREAPVVNGFTANLKLDGELVSTVHELLESGTGVPIRKDGEAVGIAKFGLYEVDGGQGDIVGGGLFMTVEGIYNTDSFELQNAYRIAITPPPEYVLAAERAKENRFEDSPIGQAINKATGATGMGPDAKVTMTEDGDLGTITMPDGSERPLTAKELKNLKANLGGLLQGGIDALTPGAYVIDDKGQLTKDGQVVSNPGAGAVDPPTGKKKKAGPSLATFYTPAEGDTKDAIALETGRVIGFIDTPEIRKMTEDQALRVEDATDDKPYKTYIVPPRGPLPGQYKDEKDDEAPKKRAPDPAAAKATKGKAKK